MQLGEWRFKAVKTKEHDWGQEHSGTYVNGDQELKLVVNESRMDDPQAWSELFKTAETFEGRPALLDTRSDKETFMVRVGKRWRVDFKTKNPGKVDLRALARSYDFASVPN